MKSILFAAAIALTPSLAAAGDMHAFDYTGNGEPVALAAPSLTPVARSQAASAVVKAPSVAFLTQHSDYAVFMGSDVPVEIHRQALRILWATNPELGLPWAGEILALSDQTAPAHTTLAALQQ